MLALARKYAALTLFFLQNIGRSRVPKRPKEKLVRGSRCLHSRAWAQLKRALSSSFCGDIIDKMLQNSFVGHRFFVFVQRIGSANIIYWPAAALSRPRIESRFAFKNTKFLMWVNMKLFQYFWKDMLCIKTTPERGVRYERRQFCFFVYVW
jgi:hypothetical protein